MGRPDGEGPTNPPTPKTGDERSFDAAKTSAVIFDMDGVLALTSEVHVRLWDEYFKQIGHDPGPKGARSVLGRRALDVLAELRPDDPPDRKAEEAARLESYSHQLMLSDPPRLADGAVRLLDELNDAGARLALATSATREGVDVVLGPLAGSFRAIISAEDVRQGKPDPEIYLAAADRLGVDPRFCTVVEDTPAGVLAARAAGMQVIGVEGTVPAAALHRAGADRVVPSLAAMRAEDLCRPVS